MIRHDNPGKGDNITLFMQTSEFANKQACCGDIREQRMTTAGNRGDAIDLMVQGMTPLRNASQDMVTSWSPVSIMAVGRMNSALQR